MDDRLEARIRKEAESKSDVWLGRLFRFHPERAVTPKTPVAIYNVTENIIVPLPTQTMLNSGIMTKMNHIVEVVSEFYGLNKEQLASPSRVVRWLMPRQIAMYLCRTMTNRSFPEIGMRFGGRDHTTVMSAVKKIEAMIQYDERLADEVDVLKLKIKGIELSKAA